MAIASINPATGALLRRYDPLSAREIEQKLELAAQAAQTYRSVSLAQRRMWMQALALHLENGADGLASTITAEMGKPITAARQEVLKCATACRFYAEHAEGFLAPQTIATGYAESYVRYDPLGVVLAIIRGTFRCGKCSAFSRRRSWPATSAC